MIYKVDPNMTIENTQTNASDIDITNTNSEPTQTESTTTNSQIINSEPISTEATNPQSISTEAGTDSINSTNGNKSSTQYQSYYYSSSSRITYNKNDGDVVSKTLIEINDNGLKDSYYEKKIKKNHESEPKVVIREGNENLKHILEKNNFTKYGLLENFFNRKFLNLLT